MTLIDIKPDHCYDNVEGGIPVFRPTMEQFKDFPTFVESIVSYGREAGLVKIIPPKEWTTALPDLSERLSSVRIKTPIIQHIRGTKGTYTQTNIESRKSYTVAEFKALSEDSDHRPPSRKGAPHGPADPLPRRKRNRKPAGSVQPATVPVGTDSIPTTPTHNPDTTEHFMAQDSPDALVPSSAAASVNHSPDQPSQAILGPDNLARRHFLRRASSPSPVSRRPTAQDSLSSFVPETKDDIVLTPAATSSNCNSIKQKEAKAAEQEKIEPPMTNYKVEHGEDYTVEYCKEVERNYWRNLTFVQPMYGADMSGSLFDERTTSWNTQCLGDLLSKIDQNLPGVNTPYLYFGMWKATFAWHVEDMDLYSINYLHFGAPKQWYCIRPENSSRFECIAQGIFSSDYKNCPQFLRHKTYLLSPSKLATDGVPVNRLVQHEGEFVLTFPFAYHSGYNLGFNCAESINFALNDWIPIGRKAESCKCINDSVQIDVEAIFQSSKNNAALAEAAMETSRPKSRSSKKTTDVEMKDEMAQQISDEAPRKRKRSNKEEAADMDIQMETDQITSKSSRPSRTAVDKSSKGTAATSNKKAKAEMQPECCFCPLLDYDGELLPTDSGKYCHMLCAQYIPETYMSGEEDDDVIVHVEGVPAARRKLRQTKEKETEYNAWKDMMVKKLKPGLSVWARWNDNMYYSGVVESVAHSRLNCKIQFHDGYNKTVTWKDISLDKKQPELGFRTAGYSRM
ncbi:Lysine-specific demethylase 4B [Mortierella alpina]|nr:Lysine-specific demethylase 4B [Mortierella alpina]